MLKNADGKLGPNLRPSKGGCRSFFQREAVNVGLVLDRPNAGEPEPEPPCLLGVSSFGISTTNMPMSDFVKLLALRPQLNRTVLDRTDLSDRQRRSPDGKLSHSSVPILTDAHGAFTHTIDTMILELGRHELWVVDDRSGRTSNHVQFEVTFEYPPS